LHNENGAQPTTQTKKTTILTQRVAHTFDGTVPRSPPKSTLTEPPKQAPPISPTATTFAGSLATTESENVTITSDLSVQEIEAILNTSVQNLKDNQLAVSLLLLIYYTLFAWFSSFLCLKKIQEQNVRRHSKTSQSICNQLA
jgi:hypothetical protein